MIAPIPIPNHSKDLRTTFRTVATARSLLIDMVFSLRPGGFANPQTARWSTAPGHRPIIGAGGRTRVEGPDRLARRADDPL
jgi:hypothetical protein